MILVKPEEIVYPTTSRRKYLEKQMIEQKHKQAGIAFPSQSKQENLLIVRLDIFPSINLQAIKDGLKRLCTFFESIDSGVIKINQMVEDTIVMSPLSIFNFSATIGFGKSFFRKLNLLNKCPKNLIDMPAQSFVDDNNSQTLLSQTDIIIQICSSKYSLNNMILQNDQYLFYDSDYQEINSDYLSSSGLLVTDILNAINGWATIIDHHIGFLRTDGRNLKGFYDGISNPDRMNNDVIWTSSNEEWNEPNDGTYMVFHKIEHNLETWSKLDLSTQERLIGRSKATGLLLGTISSEREKRLATDLHSSDQDRRNQALQIWRNLINQQKNPKEKFFDPYDIKYVNIYKNCPIDSHVRTVNPRKINKPKLIFRRGYVYMEGIDQNLKSGLLFISFQKDIRETFESITKITVNNRYTSNSKNMPYDENYLQNTSIKKISELFNNINLGGGYYFIPPIPNQKISEIGQEFFA